MGRTIATMVLSAALTGFGLAVGSPKGWRSYVVAVCAGVVGAMVEFLTKPKD